MSMINEEMFSVLDNLEEGLADVFIEIFASLKENISEEEYDELVTKASYLNEISSIKRLN